MRKILSAPVHNTFGIGVMADRYVEYSSVEELQQVVRSGLLDGRYMHVGGGSNLLFVNERYDGTVLHSCIQGVEVLGETDDEVRVRAGAGCKWDDFVSCCVAHGWCGVENLSLIPGEVGASAVQNIGAYGVEAKDVIDSVETMDARGVMHTFGVSECGYGYRESIFKHEDMKDVFVTHVVYRLYKKPQLKLDYEAIRAELADMPGDVTLAAVRGAIINIRRRKLPDPETLGNAGSFFKNPIVAAVKKDELLDAYPRMPHYDLPDGRAKIPAGWLIEQCGWKGKSLGHAAVYDKQALVIVNTGGATGQDIVRLSDAVRRDVFGKFGVEISPEVNFIE